METETSLNIVQVSIHTNNELGKTVRNDTYYSKDSTNKMLDSDIIGYSGLPSGVSNYQNAFSNTNNPSESQVIDNISLSSANVGSANQCNSENNIGDNSDITKRKKIIHDYKKLAKSGYSTNSNSAVKHQDTSLNPKPKPMFTVIENKHRGSESGHEGKSELCLGLNQVLVSLFFIMVIVVYNWSLGLG